MLNVAIMLNVVIELGDYELNTVMLNIIMLNVIILNVVASLHLLSNGVMTSSQSAYFYIMLKI